MPNLNETNPGDTDPLQAWKKLGAGILGLFQDYEMPNIFSGAPRVVTVPAELLNPSPAE